MFKLALQEAQEIEQIIIDYRNELFQKKVDLYNQIEYQKQIIAACKNIKYHRNNVIFAVLNIGSILNFEHSFKLKRFREKNAHLKFEKITADELEAKKEFISKTNDCIDDCDVESIIISMEYDQPRNKISNFPNLSDDAKIAFIESFKSIAFDSEDERYYYEEYLKNIEASTISLNVVKEEHKSKLTLEQNQFFEKCKKLGTMESKI